MNRPTIALAFMCCAIFTPLAFSQQVEVPPMTDKEKARMEAVKTALGVGIGTLVCTGFVTLFISFIPVGIALVRGHPDTVAIALISILFGWTCIGFAVALIWSVKSFPRDRQGRARDY